jgi:hypothetical protein
MLNLTPVLLLVAYVQICRLCLCSSVLFDTDICPCWAFWKFTFVWMRSGRGPGMGTGIGQDKAKGTRHLRRVAGHLWFDSL